MNKDDGGSTTIPKDELSEAERVLAFLNGLADSLRPAMEALDREQVRAMARAHQIPVFNSSCLPQRG